MTWFYMLPFMIAMFVAMDNGIHVKDGYQLCIWIAYVGGLVIDILKCFRKR